MPRKSTLPPDAPVWLTEDRRIDEMTFCCSFLEAHPMKCVHGKLYTVDGLISDEAALTVKNSSFPSGLSHASSAVNILRN